MSLMLWVGCCTNTDQEVHCCDIHPVQVHDYQAGMPGSCLGLPGAAVHVGNLAHP